MAMKALSCSGLLVAACWALPGALAKDLGAHQHGAATLTVAVDGPLLEISLESPLDNLLRFERAPRTDAERQAVRQMAQRFHGGGLFVPTPQAQCRFESAELTSAALGAALLAAPGASAPAPATVAKKDEDAHADLEATLRYRCAQPAALKGVELALFKAFPKFRSIDAAVVSGSGQRGAKLSPKQTLLTW